MSLLCSSWGAHHCILRTCELLSLRTTDAAVVSKGILLLLRDTEVGQRMGVHQEVAVKDVWLVAPPRRSE